MRDPVEIEIFKNVFHSIAEEMGAALRRTAFSPNIKERRDYSCAVFDCDGEVIAMGDHMPVHLGSMPMSVRAVLDTFDLDPGDVAILNDPFRGGTHLPDITLVSPVYVSRRRQQPQFYVASRAHHADVGGTYPGSMGLCREIYQEGFRIPPVKIARAGKLQADVLAIFLNNVRTPEEREGDLGAQIAACHTGGERLRELCTRYTPERVKRAAGELLDYSEDMMRRFLQRMSPATYSAEDFLDDDGTNDRPIKLAASITFSPTRKSSQKAVLVDFNGSDPQVQGSVNAVAAITYSACFYVFRCLLAEDVPATAGLMRPIEVICPEGTIVNARRPAAVAGGNVETSQRIVDVLLRALAQAFPDRVPAAASGTMNNVTIGGIDPRTNEPFAYYETIAGGMGARPTKHGVSGVHTHMTNSLNTPAEALEYAYPLRVHEYSLRRNSGGRGRYDGGDGIIREFEVLADAECTLLSDRRRRAPYGLNGGGNGAPGRAAVVLKNGSCQAQPGKFNLRLQPGDRIRIETPGGGGWGKRTRGDR
ncbi:MAG: hydantoinase B/oxoprolinase family protein [Acidobacteriaceae bacterium]|nr:hydantoinase B/oxoprolinase family protein [Acidobacteriaceae bacterium]